MGDGIEAMSSEIFLGNYKTPFWRHSERSEGIPQITHLSILETASSFRFAATVKDNFGAFFFGCLLDRRERSSLIKRILMKKEDNSDSQTREWADRLEIYLME